MLNDTVFLVESGALLSRRWSGLASRKTKNGKNVQYIEDLDKGFGNSNYLKVYFYTQLRIKILFFIPGIFHEGLGDSVGLHVFQL